MHCTYLRRPSTVGVGQGGIQPRCVESIRYDLLLVPDFPPTPMCRIQPILRYLLGFAPCATAWPHLRHSPRHSETVRRSRTEVPGMSHAINCRVKGTAVSRDIWTIELAEDSWVYHAFFVNPGAATKGTNAVQPYTRTLCNAISAPRPKQTVTTLQRDSYVHGNMWAVMIYPQLGLCRMQSRTLATVNCMT